MRLMIALACTVAASAPALAQDYLEYPAPVPFPLPHSAPTGQVLCIPPYRHAFVVRRYTTPPQQPFYNVPAYSVVAPY